jgi:thiamine kinase-like enzyme
VATQASVPPQLSQRGNNLQLQSSSSSDHSREGSVAGTLLDDDRLKHDENVIPTYDPSSACANPTEPIDPIDDDADTILLDLNGLPLTKDYLAEKMGIDPTKVESYKCHQTFRGFMSDGCRVELLPSKQTAFYKRVVFQDLKHCHTKQQKAPFKLVRDVQSHHVVASWLSSKACRQLCDTTQVHIPLVYDAQEEPNLQNPIESKFSLLLEDLSPKKGWYQTWLLSELEECHAALSAYAKIHAFFWHGSSFWRRNDQTVTEEFEAALWPSGSYVQPKAQDKDQCEKVASEWSVKRTKLEKEMSQLTFWDDLGSRLETVVQECGRLAHPFADSSLLESFQQFRTWTHGDPKQANLFFRRLDDDNLEVGLIDFQWTGFGLAATDIAHFLLSSVHADLLIDGGEESLMHYYFDELHKYLVEYGAYNSSPEEAMQNFSYEIFYQQYETAVLDLCRLIIAYTWARFTEPVERDDEDGCLRTMNKTSYNKCVANAVYLMSRCDAILRARGI